MIVLCFKFILDSELYFPFLGVVMYANEFDI